MKGRGLPISHSALFSALCSRWLIFMDCISRVPLPSSFWLGASNGNTMRSQRTEKGSRILLVYFFCISARALAVAVLLNDDSFCLNALLQDLSSHPSGRRDKDNPLLVLSLNSVHTAVNSLFTKSFKIHLSVAFFLQGLCLME